MATLTRYWFRFAGLDRPTALKLGCGVTAYDYDDAMTLLAERVFAGDQIPSVVECRENVDVSTLEQRHVLPNLGSVLVRGIWFPQG